jgi:hypothetical protein
MMDHEFLPMSCALSESTLEDFSQIVWSTDQNLSVVAKTLVLLKQAGSACIK